MNKSYTEVYDNREEAIEKFGTGDGHEVNVCDLTKDQLQALVDGKTLAAEVAGEYTVFITLKQESPMTGQVKMKVLIGTVLVAKVTVFGLVLFGLLKVSGIL